MLKNQITWRQFRYCYGSFSCQTLLVEGVTTSGWSSPNFSGFGPYRALTFGPRVGLGFQKIKKLDHWLYKSGLGLLSNITKSAKIKPKFISTNIAI